MAQALGSVQSVEQRDGTIHRVEVAHCSCGGENPNCFKCDGTGYYEREIIVGAEPERPSDRLRHSLNYTAPVEASFSKDERGGAAFGVRESGRFGSNPLHDDYD